MLLHLVRKCRLEGLDIYYLNEGSGECDFVLCKGDETVQAIQVSYNISNPKTRKREINGLMLASRLTNCKDLLLLIDHENEDVSESGTEIKVRPVYEWSLGIGI